MSLDILGGDLQVQGTLIPRGLVYPPGSITDVAVSAGALLSAAKLIAPAYLNYQQKPNTAVVADTGTTLHIVRGAACTVNDIRALGTGTIATGADRTVNVDLQKSTGGGAFATILTATILLNNVSTLRTAVVGVVNTPALVAGDILQIVVTVAGAAGNQALGLHVTVNLRENPS